MRTLERISFYVIGTFSGLFSAAFMDNAWIRLLLMVFFLAIFIGVGMLFDRRER